LPPVLHVAGTNGKGSTCAFLRAAIEGAGLTAHAYTSPHLVRFNERIRVAGSLIEDAQLASVLAEVLDAAEAADIGPSFFEATTAAALLAFSRTPAEAAIIEVGLGGRLDATNIIPAPIVTGVAQLGLDHEAFLLDPENGPAYPPLERIGFEKASIAKSGAPLVTMAYPKAVAARVAEVAAGVGVPLVAQTQGWDCTTEQGQLLYRDANGALVVPLPRLPGQHQWNNAGLAIAMLRHQSVLNIPETAYAKAMSAASWPARLQLLTPGPLTEHLPQAEEIWLDGGHNPNAAEMIASFFERRSAESAKPDIILGMLANKNARTFLQILAPVVRSITAVPISGHEHHGPEALMAMAKAVGIGETRSAADVETALDQLATARAGERPNVAILGSLYLAGLVLQANAQLPD
jgi:dihydrofolate synthase/folylpolyglutamate synthase